MAEVEDSEEIRVCINETLTDDELRSILSKLQSDKDTEGFGLVCKRWLHLQSTERKKLCARAGPHMLIKLAARFTSLVELDLSQSASRSFYPGVTDSDLSVIASGFRCLQILNLQNCKEGASNTLWIIELVVRPDTYQGVTDAGLISLGNGLPCLQSLDVSCCRKLSDKGPIAIAESCCNLRSLHLLGCRFITDGLLKSLSKNCPNLEKLGLQGCINITDSGLAILVEGCQRINFLDISKCSHIGDTGVSSVAKACSSSLRNLKLLDCYKVGDNAIFSLAQSCKILETLVIGGCRKVSDESIKSLVINCNHSLKHLRMDWCSSVSDSSLGFIFSLCRNLEALDIGCCEEVTDESFRELRNIGFESHLKVLKVSNCPKITVSGIGMLLDSCKYLEYLDLRSCPNVTKADCFQAGLGFPVSCKVNFTGSLSELDAFVDVFL